MTIRWDVDNLLNQVQSVCAVSDTGCWIWVYNNWTYTPEVRYPRIMIRGIRQPVSRWVLIATGHLRPTGMEACHSCDNTSCCNPDHLRWDTHKNNMKEMGDRGRGAFQKYPEIVRRGDNHPSRTHPENLRSGARTGNYASGDNHWTRRLNDQLSWRGTAHHMAELNDDKVREIRNLAESGKGATIIASLLGVSRGAIRAILEGRTWKHVI